MTIPALILGSTSAYRSALLSKLGVHFIQRAPATDETPHKGESPTALALRLGRDKARSVASRADLPARYLVIGSDQVCHLDGQHYGKPGDIETARQQLLLFSGREVTFSTSLCLLDSGGLEMAAVEDFHIRFRVLTRTAIDHYLAQDKPFDCAGSIKVEAAGISLLCDSRGRDINALYGLPLMLLTDFCTSLGYQLSDFNKSI